MPSFSQRFTPGVACKVTFDPANILANTTSDQDIACPMVLPGYAYSVTAAALETGVIIASAKCTTAGTLSVRFANVTTGAINPASQEFEIRSFA